MRYPPPVLARPSRLRLSKFAEQWFSSPWPNNAPLCDSNGTAKSLLLTWIHHFYRVHSLFWYRPPFRNLGNCSTNVNDYCIRT
ncbi:unnamed protein product [Absidia cylindrospora]